MTNFTESNLVSQSMCIHTQNHPNGWSHSWHDIIIFRAYTQKIIIAVSLNKIILHKTSRTMGDDHYQLINLPHYYCCHYRLPAVPGSHPSATASSWSQVSTVSFCSCLYFSLTATCFSVLKCWQFKHLMSCLLALFTPLASRYSILFCFWIRHCSPSCDVARK